MAAAALVLGMAGCGPRLVRESVTESRALTVELRRVRQGDRVEPLGHDHPATIADVRLAHVLASITHQDEAGSQRPTIRSEHVWPLAEALALALGRAGPDDEIGVVLIGDDRRLGVFHTERITAFRAFVEGPALVLEFFAIEEAPDRMGQGAGSGSRRYEIPAKPPSSPPPFHLVPDGETQIPRGARALAVDWRHPRYRAAVSLRERYGTSRRRTVILEEEVEEPLAPLPDASALDDAQLRALDQLEAARRSGLIREDEYRRRRALVLEGRVEEAGYGPAVR
jgi:hypothetical protein